MVSEGPVDVLPLAVATRLAHVLVHEVGAAKRARVLSIKGPVNLHYELTPPYSPSDADVLVSPDDFEVVKEALLERGWVERDSDDDLPRMMRAHAVTLINPEWPCDIDLHNSFPGLLVAPATAFDALWERRTAMECAGVDITVPDYDGAFILCLLHAYRDRHEWSKRNLIQSLLAIGDAGPFFDRTKGGLPELTVRTGASVAMRDLLASRIEGIDGPTPPIDEDLLLAWRVRVSAGIGMLPPILWTALSGRPLVAARMFAVALSHRVEHAGMNERPTVRTIVAGLLPSVRRAPGVVFRTIAELRAVALERRRRRGRRNA
ncbi:hypothetical protein C5E08_06790 [Rathayibacter iranicus]|uniref:Nucleotidyltransferase family protein n=2 Tax=Rathayibacter iranicus TaxID=59737 RepID=A0AAD1AC50_9MICO|nr:nucleotidyltransferase family protein [Rathayibacter iranicus]AZZ55626.1 hypothetical protein C7V51_06810 [Rathayibacter iranicus]PPI47896.1 hypothetical protein C5E09_05860 [Rathayibacter iranicus]PPI61047.1 hypothetical protein C5E08_06790 [Rathayibacter iranicus]PPI72976.1 hypothetical protein C5E01_03860 [Rathayibacter iranicus]PWJ63939.1 putative nucleotidyltransferase-like protein [Rathayibacter iranicus NCPPB 2253 = VKM Ac-1602]